jgi:D-alanyl-D-alanine carboxypeptidase (penicillin-binding protein 5/6)
MMDYGFNMYSLDNVVSKDSTLGNIKINLGKKEYEDIVSVSDVTILNNNQFNKRNVTYDIVKNEVVAPVKKGDVVGKINIYEDGNYKYSVDLTIVNDVDKANILVVFLRNLKDILSINL